MPALSVISDLDSLLYNQTAKSKDCVRMMWTVGDWNTIAINFYKKIGGSIEKEWLQVKMENAALTKFVSDMDTTMNKQV